MRVWLVGCLVLYSCLNATHDDFLSQHFGVVWLHELLLTILLWCLGRIGSQKLCWGKSLIGCRKKKKKKKKKKVYLFNYKCKFTFQLDGCAEPTCAATCFIHFGLGYCLDNIQLMLTFSTEMILFVCLFIHFLSKLILNVLVNQKTSI